MGCFERLAVACWLLSNCVLATHREPTHKQIEANVLNVKLLH
jgi:hypothetical protein